MKHVSAIKVMVETGQRETAHDAIDNLLALGPNNIEALKLKALLYESEGKFLQETATWQKILLIDGEDPDAATYVNKKHAEAQELFYFTDELPSGGRRFMVYPKALINAAIVGLFGCVSFLLFSNYWQHKEPTQNTLIMLGVFLFLVALPWIGILATYFREIRYVSVTNEGINAYTYFKEFSHTWSSLKDVCFAHNLSLSEPELLLVLFSNDPAIKPITYDLSVGSSPIRAKTYFMKEIVELGKNISFKNLSDLKVGKDYTKMV